MNQHSRKLPEQDSNLRPPALESPDSGAVLVASAARTSENAPDSQADATKSDAEAATKLQPDYCDRCGKLCWGDPGTAEERLEIDDGTIICGECVEELVAGEP